jgi:hypothetical protein
MLRGVERDSVVPPPPAIANGSARVDDDKADARAFQCMGRGETCLTGPMTSTLVWMLCWRLRASS